MFMVALLAVLALALAAPVSADPEDRVPFCSGDETPMDNNCRAPSSQIIINDGSGLSPNLPYGLTPDTEPAI